MKVSVICVFNNEQQLEQQLKSSLITQNIKYEFIAVNNIENTFSSAAQALNFGAEKSNGDVLVFAHQDIFLKTPYELEKLSCIVYECPTGTIIGTQGVREPSRLYYTNLTSGDNYNPDFISKFDEKLYEVSCVDEGMFAMKKETWENHNFDEVLCDNWHLYCVEACLNARKNGHKVYVYPIQIHHFSKGTISLEYMKNLKRLCEVYRRDFKYIWTTCYKVRTNWIYINALVAAWVINRFARRNLH
ncbi:MAG: hypothetical protein J6A11_03620 [Lachnospiraceae bacterium]|nr:hypothetical protein [Lachnospiraceae bacterium]